MKKAATNSIVFVTISLPLSLLLWVLAPYLYQEEQSTTLAKHTSVIEESLAVIEYQQLCMEGNRTCNQELIKQSVSNFSLEKKRTNEYLDALKQFVTF